MTKAPPPRVESLTVRNYRALRSVTLERLTPLTALLGPNGSGKSTVFDVFAFLSECLSDGIRRAWDRRGRFQELRSRDSAGPIVIELKYREHSERPKFPLITYHLEINEQQGRPVVSHEAARPRCSIPSPPPGSGSCRRSPGTRPGRGSAICWRLTPGWSTRRSPACAARRRGRTCRRPRTSFAGERKARNTTSLCPFWPAWPRSTPRNRTDRCRSTNTRFAARSRSTTRRPLPAPTAGIGESSGRVRRSSRTCCAGTPPSYDGEAQPSPRSTRWPATRRTARWPPEPRCRCCAPFRHAAATRKSAI